MRPLSSWIALRPAQLGAGALVVAALAVGQVVNEHLPDEGRATRPFETKVDLGGTADMRSGTLTPVSVEGATSVTRTYGDGFVSPGVVVVLSFDFVARGERSTITYGELRDSRGRVTSFSSNGQRSAVACFRAPAGIVVHCTATVEADPRSLPGSVLALAPDYLDERFDSMAVVDLDISRQDVTSWTSQAEPLEIVPSAVAGVS